MRLILLQRVLSSTIVKKIVRFKSCAPQEVKMQVFTQKRNPLTGSTEWDVQHEDYDFHQEIARSAFADMLHDTERNKKYQRALQVAIEKMHGAGKQANVLDIGTGTGLLSIMAARLGADSIVACEAFKPMADCCEKILQLNGVAEKITLIPKRSTEITVGENGDMKEKANILVTEVFDTELIGEGALSTFTHAHKYLLEEDCIVVPDSAVIYAQVVECPTLQQWNKLNDLADEDCDIILQTPKKMKDCAGSAAVHDIQLSQLPRYEFKELSEAIPVFYYNWNGSSPLDMKRLVKQQFVASHTGTAQMVFMWWELNMDTEGRIVLSCAPWWCHPDADICSDRPQDTIPWRDHWMQAVYYLPQPLSLTKDAEATLVSCQDEYSLWFFIEDQKQKSKHYQRPICECGVHMALSRTHVSYINDGKRSKKHLSKLKEDLYNDAVVLDLNGSCLLGLATAKMGAKTVYILESKSLHIGIINDYVKENNLANVKVIPELTDEVLSEVTNIVCDPNFASSILPWENLKMAYIIYKYRSKIKDFVRILPEACEIWALPVEFQDLHKIRVPLGNCEGINMSIFDDLVESSRTISDMELEAQPLWEYPCKSRGQSRKLLEINMADLKPSYAADNTHPLLESGTQLQCINGFALWSVWLVGGKPISSGPIESPVVGERVKWDTHTRQAVSIFKRSFVKPGDATWSYQVACNLEKGEFNVSLRLDE